MIFLLFFVLQNILATISKALKHLLRKNDVEAYFAGNVVLCDAEVEFDCAPLCSNTFGVKKFQVTASVM